VAQYETELEDLLTGQDELVNGIYELVKNKL